MKSMKTDHEKQTCLSKTGAAQPLAMATLSTISSDVLFAGNREVLIVHGADSYRLRLTRQNRLILTK